MGGDTRADSRGEAHHRHIGKVGKVHALKRVGVGIGAHVWGIDPGTNYAGLTVLRPGEDKCFSTVLHVSKNARTEPWYWRGVAMMQILRTYLTCITPRDYHGHLVVGMEMPGVYAKQGDTSVRLGDIRGMFMGMLACEYWEQMGDRLHFYPSIRPASIKLILAGDGRASKQMVLNTVCTDYNEDITSFDEADSIGVALLALEQFRKEQCG